MIRVRLAIAFGLAVLAVVAVAGCGGGSSSDSSKSGDTTSEAPLSKKAFIAKADTICTETQKRLETEFTAFLKKNEINEKGPKAEKEANARAMEAIEKIGVPQLSRQAAEMRELQPPAEIQAKVDAYLNAIEKEVEEGKKDPETLAGSAKEVFAESDAAAKGIGFKVCAVHNN